MLMLITKIYHTRAYITQVESGTVDLCLILMMLGFLILSISLLEATILLLV